MTRTRLFLIVQAVLCVLTVVLLSAGAVGLLREGTALRAEDPLRPIFTKEAVRERLAPGAAVLLVSLGLTAAGLLLSVRDERADRPVRDEELARDLLAARTAAPPPVARKERALQKRLLWLGRAGFAACLVPVALYLLRDEHFPPDKLEDMFFGLLWVLVPCLAAGICCLAVSGALRNRSLTRERKALSGLPKAEGARPPAMAAGMPEGRKKAVRGAVLIAAAALIVLGIFNGSALDVLYKAIKICTECIGLG